MQVTTSIHKDYQPNLTPLWALREIGSNAIDGQTRNRHRDVGRMKIHYSKRRETLTITNEGIEVPLTAFLMGTSESRGDQDCIGKFGEGLPMACNVLSRNHFPVTISSGWEKWTPSIERSNEYQGEPVLTITRRKLKVRRDDYSVEIERVSEELYEEFRKQFLIMDSEFDESQALGSSDQRVLLQPAYHGRIYCKGVFVTKRPDLMYGYDMDGELNRDRSFMDEWTLKNKLGSLLHEVTCRHNEKFNHVLATAMFESEGVLEVSDEWSSLTYNDDFCSRIAAIFKDKYGQDAVAVGSEDEMAQAESLNLRGVRCSPLVKKILNKKFGSVADVRAKRSHSITKIWDFSDLGSHEKRTYQVAGLIMLDALPAMRGIQVEVATFHSREVRYFIDSTENGKRIRMSHDLMLEFDRYLHALGQAVLSCIGSQQDVALILAKVIEKQFDGSLENIALSAMGMI